MKVRLVNEGLFKNAEQIAKERERTLSDEEIVANISKDVLKKKVLSTFKYILNSHIEKIKRNESDASQRKKDDEITYEFLGGWKITEMFYISEYYNQGYGDDEEGYTLIEHMHPVFDFEYDVDLGRKRIEVTPYWNNGWKYNYSSKDFKALDGNESSLRFCNVGAGRDFWLLFTGIPSMGNWKMYIENNLNHWTNYWVKNEIQDIEENGKKRDVTDNDLEMLKEYDIVLNKIVVEQGRSKNITIDLTGVGLTFSADMIKDVITLMNSTFLFENNGAVILRYASSDTNRMKRVILKRQ